jgi:hypothetical protein
VSDPLELVAGANPVRGPLVLDAVVRARIERDVLAADSVRARPRVRVPVVPRVVAIALAVVAAGSAAAALGVLVGKPSAPASGTFPGRVTASAAYAVNVRPNVQGGSVGWCITDITFFSGGGGGGGGSGCSPAPNAARPVVALGGSDLVQGTRTSTTLTATTVFITTAAVAAVRISPSLTVLTRTDRQLPSGYRLAIALEHRVTHGRRPQSLLEAFGQGDHAVGLDRDGRRIGPEAGSPLSGRVHAPSQWWSANGYGLRSPSAGRCEVSLPGATPRFGSVLRALRTFPHDVAGTFLSCGYAYESYRGTSIIVALLLDARRPGRDPHLLPDALPLAGHPGVYVQPAVQLPRGGAGRAHGLTPAPLVFRRLPGAVLLLEPDRPLGLGGSSAAQAAALIDRVRACVHLHGPLCPTPRS